MQLLDRLLTENSLDRRDVGTVVATGYGRKLIHAADTTITEITCQARGVHHCTPARGRSSTSAAKTASCSASTAAGPWPILS